MVIGSKELKKAVNILTENVSFKIKSMDNVNKMLRKCIKKKNMY